MKNWIYMAIAATGVIASVAYAAATGDRLKSPVRIGQGTAVTESLTFDLGLGAGNPFIRSTSGGVVQSSNDGTNILSMPTLASSDTACALAATQTLSNKQFSTPVLAPDGSASLPGISFENQTNTGIYRQSTSVLSFTTGGSQAAVFSSSGLTLNAGILFGSGSFFKMKTFTGTLAGAGTTTLSAPSGVIVSASGWTQTAGGSAYAPILPTYTFTTAHTSDPGNENYISSATSTSVTLTNSDGSNTNAYRVVMVYQ